MKIAAISIADYAEATEGMPHDVERLFFRMLLKMYSREDGLPDSDAENAVMFGYRTIRPYKRLKDAMLEFPCGMYLDGDTIRNERVEREIETVRERKEAARINGQIHGKKGGRPKVSGKFDESFKEVSPKFAESLPQTLPKPCTADAVKSITYETLSPSPSPSPKKENPLYPPTTASRDPFGFNQSSDVIRDDRTGKLTLVNGLRSHWLEKFNDDPERLELALEQAAAYVQINSARPLEAQVSSQLARIAAEKRDRDSRYQAAANKGKPKVPAKITGRNISKDGRLIGCA